jgi:hypothetical protein
LRILGIVLALVLAVSLVLPAAALAQEKGLSKCEWDTVKWQGNENSWHLYLQHWGRTPIQAMSRLGGLCGPKTLCADLGTNCPKAGQMTSDPTRPTPYPDMNACFGGCPACRDVEPGALATCSSAADCNASLTVACSETGQAPYACPATSVIAAPGGDPVLSLPHCGFCWGISLAFAGKSWAGADIGPEVSLNNNHLNHFGICDDPSNPTGGHGGDWGITGAPHTECCALTWALQDNCLGRPYGDKCN